MLSFNVGAKIVNETGDTLWTQITIQPSDDPNEDWIDISLSEDDVILAPGSNLMFDDPAELMHALELAAAERASFIAEVTADAA